jgi:DMSO reductase anchor subunit
MRIVYSILGVLIMLAAAAVYALGPLVDFADSFTVQRFVLIATTALGILGLALTIMGVVPPRRKRNPTPADPA